MAEFFGFEDAPGAGHAGNRPGYLDEGVGGHEQDAAPVVGRFDRGESRVAGLTNDLLDNQTPTAVLDDADAIDTTAAADLDV